MIFSTDPFWYHRVLYKLYVGRLLCNYELRRYTYVHISAEQKLFFDWQETWHDFVQSRILNRQLQQTWKDSSPLKNWLPVQHLMPAKINNKSTTKFRFWKFNPRKIPCWLKILECLGISLQDGSRQNFNPINQKTTSTQYKQKWDRTWEKSSPIGCWRSPKSGNANLKFFTWPSTTWTATCPNGTSERHNFNS